MSGENDKTCLEVQDLKMYVPGKGGIFSKPKQL